MTLSNAIKRLRLRGSYFDLFPSASMTRGMTKPARSALQKVLSSEQTRAVVKSNKKQLYTYSVSNIIPISALYALQTSVVSSTMSFFSGLGTPKVSGKVPSGVRCIDPATFAPSSFRRPSKKQPEPFPGFTMIFIPDRGLDRDEVGPTSRMIACLRDSLQEGRKSTCNELQCQTRLD